jgi:hypothetical protein
MSKKPNPSAENQDSPIHNIRGDKLLITDNTPEIDTQPTVECAAAADISDATRILLIMFHNQSALVRLHTIIGVGNY